MDIPCIYSSKPPRHPQNIVLNIFPVHSGILAIIVVVIIINFITNIIFVVIVIILYYIY